MVVTDIVKDLLKNIVDLTDPEIEIEDFNYSVTNNVISAGKITVSFGEKDEQP
jgi:hypothetical protein